TQQHHLNSVHKEFEKEKLQRELKNALADWLVTDSQPFNSANGEGFLPAFQAIKEMITHTCDTAAITTDL
ncbi:13883_t:CDS:2, partial [Funneliformis geosporum]